MAVSGRLRPQIQPKSDRNLVPFISERLPTEVFLSEEIRFDVSSALDWFTQIVIHDIRFRHLFPEIMASYLDGLPSSTRIGFYGCGESSTRLVQTFPDSVKKHQAVFFSTQSDGKNEFHGFTKKTLQDILEDPPEIIFIMSHHYEKTMLSMLSSVDRNRIFTIPETIVKGIRRGHLHDVIQWADNEIDKLADQLNHLFNDKHEKVMGYVAISFGHHIPAFLKELKSNGYKIVVFTTDDVHKPISMETMVEQGFIDYYHSTASIGMLQYEVTRIVKLFRFSHLHFFLIHTNAGFIEAIIRQDACPVTVEYDDFMPLLFDDKPYLERFSRLSGTPRQTLLDQQKFIYTHAAGIVYKDAPETLDFLDNKYGQRPPALFQLPLIDRDFINTSKSLKKLSEKDGRIHIVFPHGLHVNPMFETFFDHRTLFRTIEILNARGIHFSIYNSLDTTGQGYEDYIMLAQDNPLFDYHFCVPFYDFLPVLSQYDFGWASYDFIHGDRFAFYIKTTMGKKIFSYVNAGIPTIISPELEHMCRYILRNHIGEAVGSKDWHRLDSILASFDFDAFRKGLDHVRNELDITSQAQRMTRFFDKITQDSGTR